MGFMTDRLSRIGDRIAEWEPLSEFEEAQAQAAGIPSARAMIIELGLAVVYGLSLIICGLLAAVLSAAAPASRKVWAYVLIFVGAVAVIGHSMHVLRYVVAWYAYSTAGRRWDAGQRGANGRPGDKPLSSDRDLVLQGVIALLVTFLFIRNVPIA